MAPTPSEKDGQDARLQQGTVHLQPCQHHPLSRHSGNLVPAGYRRMGPPAPGTAAGLGSLPHPQGIHMPEPLAAQRQLSARCGNSQLSAAGTKGFHRHVPPAAPGVPASCHSSARPGRAANKHQRRAPGSGPEHSPAGRARQPRLQGRGWAAPAAPPAPAPRASSAPLSAAPQGWWPPRWAGRDVPVPAGLARASPHAPRCLCSAPASSPPIAGLNFPTLPPASRNESKQQPGSAEISGCSKAQGAKSPRVHSRLQHRRSCYPEPAWREQGSAGRAKPPQSPSQRQI